MVQEIVNQIKQKSENVLLLIVIHIKTNKQGSKLGYYMCLHCINEILCLTVYITKSLFCIVLKLIAVELDHLQQ